MPFTRPGKQYYNIPFVRRLLPGKKVALVLLAYRRLGLIVQAGNPLHIRGLEDLPDPKVKFINRQPGSGTRVWLDAQLHHLGIDPDTINGYRLEVQSLSAVAHVAGGIANWGLDWNRALATGWISNSGHEEYQLVESAAAVGTPVIKAVLEWSASPSVKEAIRDWGGYDTTSTGETKVITT